jgi:hypothetical protein
MVVSLADSDIITVLLDKNQHRTRLPGIGGPESDREGCRILSKTEIPISLENAGKNYQRCWVCDPLE